MRKGKKPAKRTKKITPCDSRRRNPAGPKKPGRAGRRRPSRKNPGDIEAAAEMSEAFHGRPARRVTEYEESNDSPRTLAELGALLALEVDTPTGERIELTFGKGVKLAANPASGQLYIVGGDQSVSLEEIGLEDEAAKDHSYIGEVVSILYHTKKGFHNFEPIDYHHVFGEDGGRCPRLSYDTINRRLYLSGGSYTIEPEGITN